MCLVENLSADVRHQSTERPGSNPGAHTVLSIALLLAALTYTYWHVWEKLVHDWRTNDNYSHGFLVVPLALYLAWERRARLTAPVKSSLAGLAVILLGVVLFIAGVLGAELFLTRVSMLVVVAGCVLYVAGWHHLRALAFPLTFLLLMIPIPALVFNEIAFPLQLMASKLGEFTLRAVGIPVLREGNMITLASVTLEVAEACSGIRSLVSLLTLSIIYSYFCERRWLVRCLLVALTPPIAILANGLRVAAIGIAAHLQGPQAADGSIHTASGWLVFMLAFGALIVLHRATAIARDRWPIPGSTAALTA
jgi:exosortase